MILVRHIIDAARKRLAMVSREAPVSRAAEILAEPNTPLVVVCDSEGVAVGVISGSDIVKALARSGADAHQLHSSSIMTRSILSCHVDQSLQKVWEALNERSIRAVPVFDDSGRPLGVVHARDLARALIDEANEEEGLLRDYVLGVGYQ